MLLSITAQAPHSLLIRHSRISQPKSSLRFHALRFQSIIPPQHASRSRIPKYSQDGSNLVNDPRKWRRSINSAGGDYDEEDEDDEDRSLDLLIRFVSNIFKKVSKGARKAVRSVLPFSISNQLVKLTLQLGFSVNGILVLAFLWILKGLLEVVCTFASVVFVSILSIRGILSGVAYLQESRNRNVNELDEEHNAWTRVQPVT